MRIILIIILLLALIGAGVYSFFGPRIFPQPSTEPTPVTLTMYGLWEDEALFMTLAKEYTQKNPHVTIEYKLQNSLNYRTRVQTQIQEGQGPDIFMIHNSWIPMFLTAGQLSSAPNSVIDMNTFKSSFYPVATQSLSDSSGRIYAIPLEIDGLSMFYNEDLVRFANVSVNDQWTWDQFRDAAVRITVPNNGEGAIQTAGAAFGSTKTVEHWSDIIGLLFHQQPGANLTSPGNDAGADVLEFYTGFVKSKTHRVWSDEMGPAIDAFAAGKVGFYFGPSWRAHDIKAKNSNLKFSVAPVPQIPGSNVGWGTFWVYGVSSKSKNSAVAWDFLKFLSSADMQKKYYELASSVPTRAYGLPYSRVDMQNELINHPRIGAFVKQAPIYKSWFLSSSTGDAGLNDRIISAYKEAVDVSVGGGDTKKALQKTQTQVGEVLREFRL